MVKSKTLIKNSFNISELGREFKINGEIKPIQEILDSYLLIEKEQTQRRCSYICKKVNQIRRN